MRKYNLLIIFSLLVLVTINVMFFRNFYKIQVAQYKNLLFKQSEVCASEIERVVQKFESDLNYILFSDDIAKLFADKNTDGLQKLQMFYSTYNNMIKNIDIYDNNKNVLNLFRDKKLNFITDRYIAQRQRKLADKDIVITKDSDYQYILPVFKDNELFANILVTTNLNDYILSELEKFHLEGLTWQWVIDIETGTVSNTRNGEYKWNSELETVLENLKHDYEDLLIHKIASDSLEHKVLSVYAPVKMLHKDFGIALSIDYNTFLMQVFSQLTVISALSLLIFIVVSLILWFQIKGLKKKIVALI